MGALGLGINAITWWNSLYIDAAVKKLEACGLGIGPEIRSRLSPLLFEHINSCTRLELAHALAGVAHMQILMAAGEAADAGAGPRWRFMSSSGRSGGPGSGRCR